MLFAPPGQFTTLSTDTPSDSRWRCHKHNATILWAQAHARTYILELRRVPGTDLTVIWVTHPQQAAQDRRGQIDL
jgi:hypothetical protein